MEPAKAAPDGVQLIFLWFIVSLVNAKWSFNFALVIRQKISAKNLYCAGGGWWVDGGQKGPSIFLKFKYVKN